MKFLVPEQEEMVPGTERLYLDCQGKMPKLFFSTHFSNFSNDWPFIFVMLFKRLYRKRFCFWPGMLHTSGAALLVMYSAKQRICTIYFCVQTNSMRQL